MEKASRRSSRFRAKGLPRTCRLLHLLVVEALVKSLVAEPSRTSRSFELWGSGAPGVCYRPDINPAVNTVLSRS
eukprot:symbB.v1.2.003338.t1/scaffold172.1/size290804/4